MFFITMHSLFLEFLVGCVFIDLVCIFIIILVFETKEQLYWSFVIVTCISVSLIIALFICNSIGAEQYNKILNQVKTESDFKFENKHDLKYVLINENTIQKVTTIKNNNIIPVYCMWNGYMLKFYDKVGEKYIYTGECYIDLNKIKN